MGERGRAARCADLSAPLRRTTARKVTATIATVAAWTAVTGLGTFGRFEDGTSLAPRLGAASVALAVPATLASVPLEFAGLLPGGSLTRPVTLVNDGGAGLASVAVTGVATTSSRLDTDPVHGLQVSIASCTLPWTPDGGCAGETTQVPAGPIIRTAHLAAPATRTSGGTDHLAVTVSLPSTAGNEFSGLDSVVVLTFTAVAQ
jgi:hypothetical protein